MDDYKIGYYYVLRDQNGQPVWGAYRGGDPEKNSSWYRTNVPVPPERANSLDGFPADAVQGVSRVNVDADRPSYGLRDAARMFVHGLTLSTGDDVAGLFGQPGQQLASAHRGEVDRIRREFPGRALGTEVAGELATAFTPGLRIGSALIRAGLPPAVASSVAGAVSAGTTTAIKAAGEAEPGQKLAAAKQAAPIGAAVGGVAGPLLRAGGLAIDRALGGAMTPRELARTALVRSLRDAGLTPEEALARLETYPNAGRAIPEGGMVLADVDPALARASRTARNLSPALEREGSSVSQVLAREAGSPARVARAIEEQTGFQGLAWRGTMDGYEAARKEVSDYMYRPLDAQGYNFWNDDLEQAVLGNRQIAEAMKEAADFDINGTRPLSFRQLQSTRNYLDGKINEHIHSGNTYYTQAYRDAFRQLDEAMKRIPGVAETDRVYARAVARRDALQLGHDSYNKGVEEMLDDLNRLPDETARNAYRHGVVNGLYNKLNESGAGRSLRNRFINPGDTDARRMSALFELGGRDPKFQALLDEFVQERVMNRTAQALTGNSNTARQLFDMDNLLRRLPRSASEAIERIVFGLEASPSQRQRAGELLADALLSQGDEAMQALARTMTLRSYSGGLGALLGTEAGTERR